MNWENLKQEKCPKCGAYLVKTIQYECQFCNFKISFGKKFSLCGKVKSLESVADELLRNRKKILKDPHWKRSR